MFEPGSGGIYRTDNYGLRWQRSAGEPGQDIRLLTAVPDQPGTLFAAGYHGLFKSSDGGKTWNGKTSLSASAGHVTSLLAFAHNVLLAGTDQGLFRSTDGIGWQLAAAIPAASMLSGTLRRAHRVGFGRAWSICEHGRRRHMESLRRTCAGHDLVRTRFRL